MPTLYGVKEEGTPEKKKDSGKQKQQKVKEWKQGGKVGHCRCRHRKGDNSCLTLCMLGNFFQIFVSFKRCKKSLFPPKYFADI